MYERNVGSKIFFLSIELLIIFTLIFVISKVLFIFEPLVIFFQTLFAPTLVAFFLFYLLKPLVELINKKVRVDRSIIVVFVFLLLVSSTFLVFAIIIPILIKQVIELIKDIPTFLISLDELLNKLSIKLSLDKQQIEQVFGNLEISIGNISKEILGSLGSLTITFFNNIIQVLIVIFTVPMFLFYMLKDSGKMIEKITRSVPNQHQKEAESLLKKMNNTISSYISGQSIECLFVAVGTFIGYLIIGIDYALLFAILAGATNIIPYIGPYLGLAPVFLLTIFDSPMRALLACIVVLIVQQIDSNVVYPNIMGKSLNIHPLTIFIILLVSGNIAGLLGMILGVPIYAVARVVIVYFLDIRKLKKGDQSK